MKQNKDSHSKMSEFDSSDDETGDVDLSPLQISWLDLSFLNCDDSLGICALPGCRFKDVWRSLENDIKCLKTEGVQDVFCLCSKGELNKYRVSWLLHELTGVDINVHHYPFPDGQAPPMALLVKMVDLIKVNVMNKKKSVIHCYGGMGRSCLVAACLMMVIDTSLEPETAITKLRELRGPGAVQSVKQYNFINDFRQNLEDYHKEEDEAKRSLSR